MKSQHRWDTRILLSTALLTWGATCLNAYPRQTSVQEQQAQQQAAPDNAKANRAPGATADQQKNSISDIEISRRIRRALLEDKSLSTYAHNVKIITRDGAVTLKGPVKSEEEKEIVEAKAADVAGKENVHSRIQIARTATSNQ
jgi:hyperosmotically inducible protein